jgi:hypothetical protein
MEKIKVLVEAFESDLKGINKRLNQLNKKPSTARSNS